MPPTRPGELVRSLGAEERDTLDALLGLLRLVRFAAPPDAVAVSPAHIAGLAGERTVFWLTTMARGLGYALAGAMAGDPEAEAALPGERAEAARLLERIGETLGLAGEEGAESSGIEPMSEIERALGRALQSAVRGVGHLATGPDHPMWQDAAALLREAGAAEYDAEVLLGWSGKTKEPVVSRYPFNEPECALVLVEYALEYVEAWVTGNPVLALERRASSWYFARFSTPRGPAARPRERREQEWSLAERASLVMGLTMVEGFVASGSPDDLPVRLRLALGSLVGSVSGVFEIDARRDGTHSVLRDAVGGDRYTVYEHNDEIPYEIGWVGMGRLLPLAAPEASERGRMSRLVSRRGRSRPSLWLRSPGMSFFGGVGPHSGRALGKGIQEGKSLGLGPGITMEGIISQLGHDAKVPREVPPAGSPAEAQRVMNEANDVLLEAGFARELPEEEAPEEFRGRKGMERIQVLGYAVDPAVGEWIAALGRQVLGQSGTSGHRGPGPRRGRAKGKRRKRRT